MKKYIKLIGIALVCISVYSCQKDKFDYKEGYVGESKITNYATFTMKGDTYTSVVKGSTYTDAGAAAKEGSSDLKVTATGTVNTAVVGLYTISYSATNSDGFPASVTRYVAVIPTAEVAGVNVAGSYDYASGGTTATVTKLAPGFYRTSNLYSAATTIPAYVITSDGLNWTIPLQSTAYGRLQGTAKLAGFTSGSTLNYSVDLLDQGIAGSTRRWLKQ
ncbi:DUF5011 domain-containing protein [Mucilaginibacter sp. PAMB04274]|uniref:DUF5011 domain-containing protein n=1 Tax=Mucilaginibacter sp. PAMB04274 TaxID=3138568 RepID=UPI0031F67D38